MLEILHHYERIFNAAACFPSEEILQYSDEFHTHAEELADFFKENKFFLRCAVPEQRQELFVALKSLIPEHMKKYASPDFLPELSAYIPVEALLSDWNRLLRYQHAALFHLLAAMAYCIRTEKEMCQG